MKKQFAVFDIDGTITRTSLLQQTVKILVNRGKIGIGAAEQIEELLHDCRQKINDDDFGDYMKKAVDMMFSAMPNGLTLTEYDEIINVVVKLSISHTYLYTRQLIKSLREKNFFLIAISGSELRAVSTFAKSLGFDAWVGQVEYLHDGDKLTGEIKALGLPKDKILKSLIAKFDLDPRQSMAVGDTSTDIPTLSLVENPIVFNPNRSLFAEARKKSWMVVIERKDVVYGLTMVDGEYVLKQVNI